MANIKISDLPAAVAAQLAMEFEVNDNGTSRRVSGAQIDTLVLGATNGFVARTGTNARAARTLTAGTGIAVSNGNGASGNPTVALSTAAQASLGKAESAVQPARAILAGTGLSGGGDLSADRTVALSAAAQASLAAAETAVQPEDLVPALDVLASSKVGIGKAADPHYQLVVERPDFNPVAGQVQPPAAYGTMALADVAQIDPNDGYLWSMPALVTRNASGEYQIPLLATYNDTNSFDAAIGWGEINIGGGGDAPDYGTDAHTKGPLAMVFDSARPDGHGMRRCLVIDAWGRFWTQIEGNPGVPVGENRTYQTAYTSSIHRSYFCRAWVNFDGTTGVIRAGSNVSSIIRHGTGDYTANFVSAMPDANYAAVATGGSFTMRATSLQVAAVRVASQRVLSGIITTEDANPASIAIFR